MRIGIDLDDTIFSTSEQYRKYQKDYLMKHNISEEKLWNNREHRLNFIKNNIDLIFSDIKLKDDCIDVLQKLEKDGNEIYIITARNNDYCDDMYSFTKQSIDKFNIPYTKLLLTEKYKLKSCLDNNIDIMIDDSKYVYGELTGKIKTILFDDKEKYLNEENRVSSWKEIYDLLGGKK